MQHCISINIDDDSVKTVFARSPQRYDEIDFATEDDDKREEGSDGDGDDDGDDEERMRNCVKRVLSSPPPPPKILKCISTHGIQNSVFQLGLFPRAPRPARTGVRPARFTRALPELQKKKKIRQLM